MQAAAALTLLAMLGAAAAQETGTDAIAPPDLSADAPLAAPLAPGSPAPTEPGSLTDPVVTPSALLVVDQDRLFADSRFGAAALRLRETDEKALEDENRRIEAALEAEERALTDRRATLPAAEFRALATAFDGRVEDIRSAQDGKARDIARRQDEDRKRFFAAAVPVLADLMGDLGAVALIDTSVVLLSFDRIDITDAAIGRIDAALGDGDDGTLAPAPDSAPPVPGATP